MWRYNITPQLSFFKDGFSMEYPTKIVMLSKKPNHNYANWLSGVAWVGG